MGKESRKLTVLQINDTHGYLDEHQETFQEADAVNAVIISAAVVSAACL